MYYTLPLWSVRYLLPWRLLVGICDLEIALRREKKSGLAYLREMDACTYVHLHTHAYTPTHTHTHTHLHTHTHTHTTSPQIGTDFLEEAITSLEDYVQSVDVAAFNKV